MATLESPGVLAPEVRIGASRTETVSLSTADGSGAFTWSRVLLEACPLRFQLGPTLDVRPCITSAAGVLHADGHGNGMSSPPQNPVWLEIGGAASVEWRIIGRLSVLGGVGFSLPASRPTFFFENATMASETTTVYQPPTHAGEARLGLAIRFL
jgi:hypothetical protein